MNKKNIKKIILSVLIMLGCLFLGCFKVNAKSIWDCNYLNMTTDQTVCELLYNVGSTEIKMACGKEITKSKYESVTIKNPGEIGSTCPSKVAFKYTKNGCGFFRFSPCREVTIESNPNNYPNVFELGDVTAEENTPIEKTHDDLGRIYSRYCNYTFEDGGYTKNISVTVAGQSSALGIVTVSYKDKLEQQITKKIKVKNDQNLQEEITSTFTGNLFCPERILVVDNKLQVENNDYDVWFLAVNDELKNSIKTGDNKVIDVFLNSQSDGQISNESITRQDARIDPYILGGSGQNITFDPWEKDCSIFGDSNDPDSVMYLLQKIFNYFKFAAPVLIVVFGMLDFTKAIMSNEADALKKSGNKFIKRLVAAVLLFLLPTILTFILSMIDQLAGYNGACGIK